ncbi:hypothetical protein [Zobellella endophytica]
MRLLTLLKAALLSLTLTACVAPMLAMGPGQLMWALLKPMVGLDPNSTNLFEQPVIKTRMTSLLGPNYDTTVNLLRTATELQQEGPMFYLMSRYSPLENTDKAGLVWNSETNQMAALLSTDEQTRVFSESHTGRAAVWPQAMQGWLTGKSSPAQAAGTALLGGATAVVPGQAAAGAPQPAAVAQETDTGQLQSELAAAQARLQEAEAKLQVLEAAQQPAPEAVARPEPEAGAGELSREQAEAAMEALLNQ